MPHVPILWICLALCLLGAAPVPAAQATPVALPEQLRLYALDCGHATLDDAGVAADTGELDGVRLELADPCFLIRHPKGWLLWDSAALLVELRSGPVAARDP